MKLKYRLIKILFLILSLFFLMNFAIKRHDNRDINEINIQIDNSDRIQFITKDMVKQIVGQSSHNGIQANKIKDINTIKTEESLNANPFILKNNVYIDLNGEINIHVVQKQPIARIKTNKDEFYLDNYGNSFPLSKNFSLPCLLVNGEIHEDEYEGIANLVQVICKDNLLKNHIVGIEKVKKDLYNLILNVSDCYIEYGKIENNKQKLTNLKEFYTKYLDYVGFSTYKKISLMYDNQIVATKR